MQQRVVGAGHAGHADAVQCCCSAGRRYGVQLTCRLKPHPLPPLPWPLLAPQPKPPPGARPAASDGIDMDSKRAALREALAQKMKQNIMTSGGDQRTSDR